MSGKKETMLFIFFYFVHPNVRFPECFVPSAWHFGDGRCVNVWVIFCFSRSCPSGCWLWFVFNAQVSLYIFPNEIECGKNVDLLSEEWWRFGRYSLLLLNATNFHRNRHQSSEEWQSKLYLYQLNELTTTTETNGWNGRRILITTFRLVFLFVTFCCCSIIIIIIINRSRSETGWTLSVKCWFFYIFSHRSTISDVDALRMYIQYYITVCSNQKRFVRQPNQTELETVMCCYKNKIYRNKIIIQMMRSTMKKKMEKYECDTIWTRKMVSRCLVLVLFRFVFGKWDLPRKTNHHYFEETVSLFLFPDFNVTKQLQSK